MNAIDYVKQNGIEKAKIHLEKMKAERWVNSFFNDLKQIVDAFELVEKDFGSVEIAEYEHMVSGCYSDPYWIEVRKAINLVEKCKK